MSTSYFQGGDFVELLSAQGKAPAAQWKLQGKIVKSFEKLIKGNAFLLDGSADTRMQLPKGGASSTSAAASLGLTQRFLVLQLLVPFTKSFSLEIGFSDLQRARRRFVISSAFREPTVTALHAQIPLGAATISRDVWINLVLDLQALTDTFFAGSVFRSMESLAIGGSCRLKRVFTMKDPPTPSSCVSDNNTADIPRQFVFSSCKDGALVPTEYFLMQGHGRGAADVKPASDTGGRDKRAGFAGPGLIKGKSVAVNERKATPDAKKKNIADGGKGAKRPGVPLSRSGKPRLPSRGTQGAGVVSEQAKETSEAMAKKEPAPSRAARATPREATKQHEACLSTPTLDLDNNHDWQSPRHKSPVSGVSNDEASPCRDRNRPRTAWESSSSPALRPTSAVSTRSNVSVRSAKSLERQDTHVAVIADDEHGEVKDEKGVKAHERPVSRPTSSRGVSIDGDSRREVISEIQHKLDLLVEEDDRAGDRNRELFLRHTTISGGLDLGLDDSALGTIAEDHVDAIPHYLRESLFIDNSARESRCEVPRSTSARSRLSASGGGVGASRGPKKSIFAFSSGSASDEAVRSRASSSGSLSQAGLTATLPVVSSKLFDFDALLDSIDSPAITADPVAAVPIDSLMEATRSFHLLNEGVDGDMEELADSGSDHELELLLAAKRDDRRKKQHQMQLEVRRSASDSGVHGKSQLELGESQLVQASTRETENKKRGSASIWRFSDQVPATSNVEGVEDDGDNGRDHGDDGVDSMEDGALMDDDQALQNECGNDTGNHDQECDQQDDRGDDDDVDDLSIDLTGELEDFDQAGDDDDGRDDGEDDTSSPTPSSGRAAPDATLSPVEGSMPRKTPQISASRASGHASALSTSFDFGDLVEGEEEGGLTKKAAKHEVCGQPSAEIDSPLQNTSSSMLLSPPDANFDFGDLTDVSKPDNTTASPVIAGESSTGKRLQRLLESTEWRSLPAPAPDAVPNSQRQSERRERGKHPGRQPLAPSSASPVAPASATCNSIELVYDPVLRCYYDPVADKYYALAK